MSNIAFIFARGGSVGIPKKNIRLFCGKPLIVHSIEFALSHPMIDRVFVSTDSPEITNISEKAGATTINRPAELATSEAAEWHAWQHAIEEINDVSISNFISLPCTAPLRSQDDISRAIKRLDRTTDIVITMSTAKRNPWFNMLCEKNGYVGVVNVPERHIVRRQDAPACYDMNTVAYVTTPDYIRSTSQLFAGKVRGILVPEERSIDIDSELDFEIAEFLYKRSKLNG